jgi:regulator of sigma E protease
VTTVILFLVVIVILVVGHELGHFFVAKAFGVRVDEFGIGYPPRAKKLFTWKKTVFTLNWLPFGGFVRIFDEDATSEEHRAGSFAYAKMYKRVLIIAAGIIANMVIAMVLYAISFGIGFFGSPSDFSGSVALSPVRALVTSVVSDSPASTAGLKNGDAIISLAAGADAATPTTVEGVISFIHAHGDEPVTLSVERNDEVLTFVATPKAGVVGAAPGIGVSLAEAARMRLPFFRALGTGVTYTLHQFKATVVGIGALVGGAFQGNTAMLSQVSGPVGIAQIAGQAYSLGIGSLLSFMALISINLAVINLLPFPALDGGRLILELFASKGKSKIPKKAVSAINQIGFLILILLMVLVTYSDIRHLIAYLSNIGG